MDLFCAELGHATRRATKRTKGKENEIRVDSDINRITWLRRAIVRRTNTRNGNDPPYLKSDRGCERYLAMIRETP